MRLEQLLIDSARKTPDAPALNAPDGSLTHGELDRLSNRIAHVLGDLGVGRGGRVCIWLDKSTVAIAVMQAALRLGAAYIPLDPLSPTPRIAVMLGDCSPDVVVTTDQRARSLPDADADAEADNDNDNDNDAGSRPTCVTIDGGLDGRSWSDLLAAASDERPARSDDADSEHDLAYILYTSGSTGTPKGVCISHRNAWAFVEWAAATIDAGPEDRLSNHAPFHFDLSVLDLYVAFLVGARVSLAPAGISYVPAQLVEFLRAERITIWYSVPSALTMMMEAGGLLDTDDLEPRVLIFAGEAFPLPQLAALRRHWSNARFFNFYGPTETNVCTAYELPGGDLGDLSTVPIGIAASGDRIWLETEDGNPAPDGEVGEIIADGPTVMLGYWGREPQKGPYRTGDLARFDDAGQLEFLGRRDHMVKVRGHRIELGEIESVLGSHPAVREVAAAVEGDGRHARLVAFLVARDEDDRPGLLALKALCAEKLPRYMIVDRVRWLPALPRTGNGKVDRQRLVQ